MRKILFITLIFICFYHNSQSQNLLKEKDHSANKALAELLNDDDLLAAGFSFYAIDVNTSEVIVDYNSNLALKPASTLKLLTSATAIEVLGGDFKFITTIEYDGVLDTANNVLDGNLYIKGGGDPTLGSKYFTQTENKKFLSNWLEAVKELGIDSITGYIIGDAQVYSLDIVPPTWSWEDMGNYFGAGACGLTIYDNFYTLYFNTSSVVGGKTEITKIEPEIPNLTFDNTVKAGNTSSDDSYIFGQPYKYDRYIRGELPLNKTGYKVKGSIPDPAWLASYEFYNILLENGIKINKTPTTVRLLNLEGIIVPTKRTEIFITESPQLSEIIYELNQKSINLFAEHLLNHSGLFLDADADTKKAAEAIEDFWAKKGMTTKGLSINDGSGLSHYNTISAKQLVYILNYMKSKSRYFDEFYNSLPISGKSGTLKRVCKGTVADGKIHAKSGSIRNVRAYAGYTTSASGRDIAFAMMLNNFSCSSYRARLKLEKLMIGLVNLNE